LSNRLRGGESEGDDAKHLLAFLVCPDGRAEAYEGQPEGSRLLAKGHTRKKADDE